MTVPTGAPDWIRWFETLRGADVPLVGGKNASLGELYGALRGVVETPNGFAVTAEAYRSLVARAGAETRLRALLDDLDVTDVAELSKRAAAARALVYEAADDPELRAQVAEGWRRLKAQYGPRLTVAVRSSATAEDLPTASFAGQHESYLNVSGETALFDACRRCMASLFTDRAIVYRANNRFDHFKVALSVGVMKMVRADRAASGVVFTLDTESGFPGVVFITGVHGLGETIVQGQVAPDEFYVHKATFRQGYRTVLKRSLGAKHQKLVYGRGAATTRLVATTRKDQKRFCISDPEVLKLADYALAIEDHYACPMDIEWAKDADDGRLYVVQARPETVASRRTGAMIETYRLDATSDVLVAGKAVGEKIGAGKVRRVRGAPELASFQPGEVLVAETTSPDWEPVMRTAAAIVTDRGGRTCHAAIVARELGVPAVVGALNATAALLDGQSVTVSCAQGETGVVYAGALPFSVDRTAAADLARTRTEIMVNLGNPDLAFRTALLPCAGVGLARMEFIIGEHIRVHPMALVAPERIASAAERRAVARLTAGFASPSEYFVQRLSEGIGTIAAAFHPRPVIVRLSDFKTNEYAKLLGGAAFEPREENPMLGFRGAARYAHPAYEAGFALECAALKRVRDDMGLTNLKVMVPFCRREEEASRVLDAMARHGLKRGQNGLEVYVMCEIPNNVIRIDAFAKLFDGFSIGSNDLTQLTLGVDRDSEIVAFDFDERDPGMLEMLRLAVQGAHRNKRHVGICGEAPATYPEIAAYLTELGVDSLSVNPASFARTNAVVAAAEVSKSPPQEVAHA